MKESRVSLKIRLCLILLLLLTSGICWASESIIFENSVVQITNHAQPANWKAPWRSEITRGAHSGTGFLIEGGWIMTNAHVVSDARLILVNKSSSPEPAIATVYAIAHDSDLALLQVNNPRFLDGMTPLSFGKMPVLQSRVRTYGYPTGGHYISRTEGVISRIDFDTYIHSGVDSHLIIQTDSAINPGNSGGPVIQDQKVVGVAFQSRTDLNDVGYFIPVPLIRRFLNDMKDGTYDGVPEMGIYTNNLLSPHHRKYLGMPKSLSGALVQRIVPNSSAEGYLQHNDVLVEIDGHSIDNAGEVKYGDYPTPFYIYAEDKQVGEFITFQVWRKQELQTIHFKLLAAPGGAELRNSYDTQPPYFILGGLVFMPLSRNLLQSQKQNHIAMGYEHLYRSVENPQSTRSQVVVLTQVLASPINSGYSHIKNYIVDTLNGVTVDSLSHLKEIAEQALQNPQEKYLILKSEWHFTPIILNKDDVRQHHSSILELYGITHASNL